MATVSITEAARLTGKSRRTLQRHIGAGKLSKVAGCDSIDTSELLRVYGAFKEEVLAQPSMYINDASVSQLVTQSITSELNLVDHEKMALKAEVDKLNLLLEAKQETIDSLNKAMLLLEHKNPRKEVKISFFSKIFGRRDKDG